MKIFILVFLFLETLWGTTLNCLPVVENQNYLQEAREFDLLSNVKDSGRTLHFNSDSRAQYGVETDARGLMQFKLSAQKLTHHTNEVFIGVWEESGLYAALDESSRQFGNIKHSSFNKNRPVLGAWSMTVNQGKILEISDASGHYQPTPYHMYLTLKHLKAQGFDLSDTNVAFDYSLKRITDLKINVDDFIAAVEKQDRTRRHLWMETAYDSTAAINDFLMFLKASSQDPKTLALIAIYHIRNNPPQKSTAELATLKSFMRSGHLSAAFLNEIQTALFKSTGSKYFVYQPWYFVNNEHELTNNLEVIRLALE